MIERLLILIKVLITIYFIFIYFKNYRDGAFVQAILISSFYPTIASIIGQETGKIGIMLALYSIIVLRALQLIKKRVNSQTKNVNTFLFSIFCLFLVLTVSILYSPAAGADYFNQKVIFGIINIFFPCILIGFFAKYSNYDFRSLFTFFKVQAFLVGMMLLITSFSIGITSMLNSEFLQRTGVGESNVVWTGRFLSVGFLLLLVREKRVLFKIVGGTVVLIAMILTGSKAVLLFSILSLLFYLLILKTNTVKKSKLFAGIGITVITIFFFLSFFNPLAVERRFSTESGTIEMRQTTINDVYEGFLQSNNMIFGNGLATSGFPIISNYDMVAYPHNLTVEMLYEVGIIGVLFFYLPILLTFYFFFQSKFIRYDSNTSIVVTILFMFVMFAQTSGNMVGNTFIFVFSGFAIAIFDWNKKQSILR